MSFTWAFTLKHMNTERGKMVLEQFPLTILPFCIVKYYKKCLAQSNFLTHTAESRERREKEGQMDTLEGTDEWSKEINELSSPLMAQQ